MNTIIFSDTHYGNGADSSRPKIRKQKKQSMRNMLDHAERSEVDRFIINGDLFHRYKEVEGFNEEDAIDEMGDFSDYLKASGAQVEYRRGNCDRWIFDNMDLRRELLRKLFHDPHEEIDLNIDPEIVFKDGNILATHGDIFNAGLPTLLKAGLGMDIQRTMEANGDRLASAFHNEQSAFEFLRKSDSVEHFSAFVVWRIKQLLSSVPVLGPKLDTLQKRGMSESTNLAGAYGMATMARRHIIDPGNTKLFLSHTHQHSKLDREAIMRKVPDVPGHLLPAHIINTGTAGPDKQSIATFAQVCPDGVPTLHASWSKDSPLRTRPLSEEELAA